jgi:F0F1-type ATP synthase delta subunit
MKTGSLNLAVGVDDKKLKKQLSTITKSIQKATSAFTELNAEIEKANIVGLNLNIELKRIDKKWYQFWK